MKNLALLFALVAAFGAFGSDSAASVRPRPSAQLKARLDAGLEVYGILHFSVNTFTDREWGFGNETPLTFAPTAFDADQIVRACSAGGLQGLVVVAKHHDGFCLWRTKTTPHCIAGSPFRGGSGDVVKELSDACARGGVLFGVYVSPWDRNAPDYATDSYRRKFWEQVLELTGGAYGPVFELWFDGANGGDGYYGGACERRTIPKNYYDFAGLVARARVRQPQMAVFYDWDVGDLHYPGNEKGELHPDARCTFPARADRPTPGWEDCLNKGDLNGTLFKQPECDFPLRPGWFYHASQDGQAKSGEYLMKVYLRTVGNGGTMNVGLAPDRRGLVTDEDMASLRRFGEVRRAFFAHRAASAAEPFNVVVMKEDVTDGEQVDGWTLALDGREILRGASVGVKRIRVLDRSVSGKDLRFAVTAGRARPEAVRIELYRADPGLVAQVRAAEVPRPAPAALDRIGERTEKTESAVTYRFKAVQEFSAVVIRPDLANLGGTPVAFRLAHSADGVAWTRDAATYRLGNVAANPIPQTVRLERPAKAGLVRIEAVRTLREGAAVAVAGCELVK